MLIFKFLDYSNKNLGVFFLKNLYFDSFCCKPGFLNIYI